MITTLEQKRSQETKLTIRQLHLYYYLELRSESGFWTKRKHLLNYLSDVYNYKGERNLYTSSAAVYLTKDIQDINNDDTFNKLIISNSKKGVKLATREEAKEMLKREQLEILKKWKRWHNKVKKVGLNGQLNIDGQVIESFVEVW